MIAGRWEFAGAFWQVGSAVGPTHTFRTAREFIALNDDDPRLEWAFPAARTVTPPCASWLDLREDGTYEEHEEPAAGPHLWTNGGTRHEPDSHGTWKLSEDVAALVAHDAHERMAPLYFDEATLDAPGELHRRVVTVVDGLYVDFVRAFYRRPGTTGASPVDRWVAARIDALHAFAPETPATPETQLAVWEVTASARQKSSWACSPDMLATMGRIRDGLATLPKRAAPYKSAMKDAVERYFDALRE